jgi:hypothetical protein
MSDAYYVTTDPSGVEHSADGSVTWVLPAPGVDAVTEATTATLVLRRPALLIDDLEAKIFHAEALDPADDDHGALVVRRARLVAPTAWDTGSAAKFALDCARHVLGNAGDVALPSGDTLESVINDAATVLDQASPEAEARLGFLARVRAARRLERTGETIQAIALQLLTEDDDAAREAIKDPAWTTAATVSDAVLAAIEALRSYALPRYVASREDGVEENGTDAPATGTSIISTPWGPIALGTEHHSPYAPAWAAARDAAARARDVARETDGPAGERDERAWQGDCLEALL